MVVVAKYFKCELNYGHQGAGKKIESNRYLKMRDNETILDAADTVKRMGGVKKGFNPYNSIKPISKDEYMRGKRMETRDPWLQKLFSH